MKNIYSEVWIHIAGFLDSLKSFARFWWSIPHLVRSDLTNSSEFWKSMIRHFCETRGKDFSEIIGRADMRERGIYILRALYKTKRCSRSGCYKMYSEWGNDALQCMYHPGKLRANGYLSCCRGKGFTSAGCKAAFHDGSVFSLIHMRRDSGDESDNALFSSAGSTCSTLPSLTPSLKDAVVEKALISYASLVTPLPRIG